MCVPVGGFISTTPPTFLVSNCNESSLGNPVVSSTFVNPPAFFTSGEERLCILPLLLNDGLLVEKAFVSKEFSSLSKNFPSLSDSFSVGNFPAPPSGSMSGDGGISC